MAAPDILVLSPPGPLRQDLEVLLRRSGHHTYAANTPELWPLTRKSAFSAVVIGAAIANCQDLKNEVHHIRARVPDIPVILVAQHSSEDLAIAALRAGINGYVKYPCVSEHIQDEIDRCVGQRRLRDAPVGELVPMIGDSLRMQEIKAYLSRVAATDSNVLLTGETGTGKEVAAEFVHRNSRRKHRAFITINCAAIPDTLLESELFGYERGAFTGATSAKDGKLKGADGGTIFLDEIGDMSAFAQAKILRMIDNREIQRLGDSASTAVNARFIAATNQELEVLVREGKFRKDLFFRLNVARVHLPPLRERREDIPPIITHYLRALNSKFGIRVESFTEDAWQRLMSYEWPGNVRELKNLLEITSIHASSAKISAAELPRCFSDFEDGQSGTIDERQQLLSALCATDWNKSRAAAKLHWSRMTLYRKMARYQVSKPGIGNQA